MIHYSASHCSMCYIFLCFTFSQLLKQGVSVLITYINKNSWKSFKVFMILPIRSKDSKQPKGLQQQQLSNCSLVILRGTRMPGVLMRKQ